ncbi:hypothetical protein C1646_670380 [Rhizophagus diaphanus]|nr:hypothetical protein C1646_670380 [Rhizophagus diaphanus] [Rhizophagus sp. MUCL 43196]
MVHSDYKYYNNLDDPENDEDFINDVKDVLKQLNITDITENTTEKIKDFVTLMKFIKRLMTKQNDLEIVIADAAEPPPLVKSEIYNEQHIKWKNDELILKLINKCLEKNDEGEHKFMLVVSHLLPILVIESYKNLVDNLAIQLNYKKIPQNWCKLGEDNKFISIREHLWGYKFPSSKKSLSSIFDRFEKEPRHYATLCYVPLPGLYYTDKITISTTKSYMAAVTMVGNLNDATNTFINNMTISEAAKSNIELITKAISNVAASKINYVNITSEINKAAIEAVYNAIIYNTTFTAGINNTTINTINNYYVTEMNKAIGEIDITTINKLINSIDGNQIIIACAIVEIIVIFLVIRSFIIFKINGLAKRVFRVPSTYVIIAGNVFVITVIILKLSPKLFGPAKNILLGAGYDFTSIFQALSTFIIGFWLCGLLCLFRDIGIYGFIAFVNNIYEEVYKRKYTEWTMVRAISISYIELNCMIYYSDLLIYNYRDYFPPTIIYEANTEEFKKWHDKLPNLEKQLFNSTYPIQDERFIL